MDKITTRGAPSDADAEVTPGELPWEDHERRTMLCHKCQLPRVFRRRKTRHSLHFALSIGTIGLWLPAWAIAIAMQFLKPWTCTRCGKHQRDG